MATSWDAIATKLDWLLEEKANYDTSSVKVEWPIVGRIAAWNWAQGIFAHHTALEKEQDLVVEGRVAALPADCLDVSMLYDSAKGKFYSKADFHFGGTRLATSEAYEFWVWGGKLHLERTLNSKESLKIYYWARWPAVEYQIDDTLTLSVTQPEILIPEWAELPVAHLTCATLLAPKAIASAISAEFKIRIDLPVGEPRAYQAREHLWWYNELLGKVPAQNRLGGMA